MTDTLQVLDLRSGRIFEKVRRFHWAQWVPSSYVMLAENWFHLELKIDPTRMQVAGAREALARLRTAGLL
jgi:hypothetical protein